MPDNAPHVAIIDVQAKVYCKNPEGLLDPQVIDKKHIMMQITASDKNLCIRQLNEALQELKKWQR